MAAASTKTMTILALGVGLASPAVAQTATNLNALQGLSPFTTLLNSSTGLSSLSGNLTVTTNIQNNGGGIPTLLPFAQQQQQALKDATITGSNAYQLTDALGTTLGNVYQSKTTYTSTNDGTTTSSTNISTNLANLFGFTNTLTGSDSSAGKYFFSNGTTNGTTSVSAAAQAILTNAGGTTDVYGKAYNLRAGTTGADPYGDSRPFQVRGGYTAYNGNDFFGVASSNTAYLVGPTQNLTASPAWPSGHTTYGYTESTLLAIMVPQRFQQEITRGAEYGNDRIIVGAHYAMDVLAGRTLALYDVAQLLANNPTYLASAQGGVTITNYQTALSLASTDLNAALSSGCGNTVAVCATTNDTSRFANAAANKAFYESTQTYGLPTVYTANTAAENVATLAPEAGYLLQSRFPYLTLAQRDDVLTSTEGAGGGFLDNGSSFGVYSRLDLYAAADGYAAFTGPVNVTMDSTQGGFNAYDAWNNNISGPGSFTLNGTGTLNFTGTDTYSGPTTINGGVLVVTGSITSPTTINPLGALAGTGTVGAITVNGTIAPGLTALASPTGAATIGRLGAAGPVTFNPGSTYVVKFTPSGASDSISTSGRAQINGGTVLALGQAGTYRFNQAYPILNALGGVAGQFNNLTVSAQGLSAAYLPTLRYASNELDLVLAPNTISSQIPGGGGSANQQGIVSGVDKVLLSGNAPAPFVNLFNVPPAQLAATINALSGQAAVSTELASLRIGDQFLSSMLDPYVMGGARGTTIRVAVDGTPGPYAQPSPPTKVWTVWASVTGGVASTTGSTTVGSSQVTDQNYGVIAGGDYRPIPNARVGFALAGGGTATSVASGLGSSTGSYGQVGINGTYELGNAYVAAALAYGHTSFDVKRSIFTGGFDQLKSSPDGDLFGGRAEIGYRFQVGPADLGPYAAIAGQNYYGGSANETSLNGSSFALSYAAKTTCSVQSELGARGAVTVPLPASMAAADLTAFGRVAWAHEADRQRSINANFQALSNSGFTIYGARPSSDAALISAGAQIDLRNGFKLTANLEGDLSDNVKAFRGQVGFRYNW